MSSSNHYLIEPEVAGGWGDATVVAEPRTHPPRILELEYEFHGWLGDPLVTSFPVYLGTRELFDALEKLGATGYVEAPVTVSRDVEIDLLQPDLVLPEFGWLQPTGVPGRDDIGVLPDASLVVSQRAYDLLCELGMRYAGVTSWPALAE